MRIKSKHFWLELGVALSMLFLLPFMARGGGGPQQMIIPDIIINPPAPEAHWLSIAGLIIGIPAAVATVITVIKLLKNRKETKG